MEDNRSIVDVTEDMSKYGTREDPRIPPYKFRWDWGADPAKEEDALLYYPLGTVIFTYTGGKTCSTEEECAKTMRKLQNRDMHKRGFIDVQYNFYIGEDGFIYEGVGFLHRATKDPEFNQWDCKSFDIAFIGDYSEKDPGIPALHAARALLRFMKEEKIVTKDYVTIPLAKSRALKGLK